MAEIGSVHALFEFSFLICFVADFVVPKTAAQFSHDMATEDNHIHLQPAIAGNSIVLPSVPFVNGKLGVQDFLHLEWSCLAKYRTRYDYVGGMNSTGHPYVKNPEKHGIDEKGFLTFWEVLTTDNGTTCKIRVQETFAANPVIWRYFIFILDRPAQTCPCPEISNLTSAVCNSSMSNSTLLVNDTQTAQTCSCPEVSNLTCAACNCSQSTQVDEIPTDKPYNLSDYTYWIFSIVLILVFDVRRFIIILLTKIPCIVRFGYTRIFDASGNSANQDERPVSEGFDTQSNGKEQKEEDEKPLTNLKYGVQEANDNGAMSIVPANGGETLE